jgi:hypothetical protein
MHKPDLLSGAGTEVWCTDSCNSVHFTPPWLGGHSSVFFERSVKSFAAAPMIPPCRRPPAFRRAKVWSPFPTGTAATQLLPRIAPAGILAVETNATPVARDVRPRDAAAREIPAAPADRAATAVRNVSRPAPPVVAPKNLRVPVPAAAAVAEVATTVQPSPGASPGASRRARSDGSRSASRAAVVPSVIASPDACRSRAQSVMPTPWTNPAPGSGPSANLAAFANLA